MIVDAHTHIFSDPAANPYPRGGSVEDLLRDLDAVGVDAALVIPLPGCATNEVVWEACACHTGRLFPAYTPDFSADGGALAAMQRFVGGSLPHAIKIHPRLQGVRPDDEAVRELLVWAGGKGVPVIFDVFPFGDGVDDVGLWPLAYHRLAREHRDVTIVLAHAGGFRVMDAFMVAKANPNVVLEVSLTLRYFPGSSVEQDLAFVCRRLPAGRVIYGSDFPNIGIEESLATAKAIGGLSEQQRTAFFGDTAQQIYRLNLTATRL